MNVEKWNFFNRHSFINIFFLDFQIDHQIKNIFYYNKVFFLNLFKRYTMSFYNYDIVLKVLTEKEKIVIIIHIGR